MTNSILKHVLSLAAAASTTFVLFSAVVSIPMEDKVALAAAHAARTLVAAKSVGTVTR